MSISKFTKKIFFLTLLLSFISPIFYSSAEEKFYISPNKSIAVVGESVIITATAPKSPTGDSTESVTFAASPAGSGSFSPEKCTLEYIFPDRRCTTTFTAQKIGAFTITGITTKQPTAGSDITHAYATTKVQIANSLSPNPPIGENTDTNYVLLTELPDGSGGTLSSFESDPQKGTCNLARYLNIIIRLFLGICAVLAVIMLVYGGLIYITSVVPSEKGSGKNTIINALVGLIIALGAYLLLYTINPNLLNVCLDQELPVVDVEIEGDAQAPITTESTAELAKELPSGSVCNQGGQSSVSSIVSSLKGKVTYSKDIPKGKKGPSNTVNLDCSGFANYVLKCANLPFVNSGTSGIFASGEKVNSISGSVVNGKELKPGDLLGWKPGDNPKRFGSNGHVMIYIGGGQLADSHGPSKPVKPGQAVGTFSVEKYKDYIKYVKRVS